MRDNDSRYVGCGYWWDGSEEIFWSIVKEPAVGQRVVEVDIEELVGLRTAQNRLVQGTQSGWREVGNLKTKSCIGVQGMEMEKEMGSSEERWVRDVFWGFVKCKWCGAGCVQWEELMGHIGGCWFRLLG